MDKNSCSTVGYPGCSDDPSRWRPGLHHLLLDIHNPSSSSTTGSSDVPAGLIEPLGVWSGESLIHQTVVESTCWPTAETCIMFSSYSDGVVFNPKMDQLSAATVELKNSPHVSASTPVDAGFRWLVMWLNSFSSPWSLASFSVDSPAAHWTSRTLPVFQTNCLHCFYWCTYLCNSCFI